MAKSNETLDRIVALDGVRGIAISGVLVAHSLPALQPWLGDHILWADLGVFGVDLFFVLSGFLITRNLLARRGAPHYFSTFYARRFLRLFPVYYLYLFLLAWIVAPAHRAVQTSMSDYAGNWWWYITYFCNWKANHAADDPFLGHFWSLAIEEQFYLVWPFVIWRISGRRVAAFCVFVAATAFGFRCALASSGAEWNTIYRITVTRLDPLALGALLALGMQYDRWRTRISKYSKAVAVTGLGGLIAISIFAGGPQWSRAPIQTLGAFAAAVGFAGLTGFATTTSRGLATRILSSRFLTALGRYSYCMYVIHVLVFAHMVWITGYLARGRDDAGYILAAGILASMGIVFIVARLSWKYFELPIQTKGKSYLSSGLADAPAIAESR